MSSAEYELVSREQPGGPLPGSRRKFLLRLMFTIALAGVVVGGLWAWLAPPIHGVVALSREGERVRGFVGEEADHLFLGAFLMVGMLSVLGVCAGVVAWKQRAFRGPATVGALSLGALLAAAAATGVGAGLARLRYGAVDVAAAPVSPEHRVHYVVEAPGVFFGHSPLLIAATIVFPAGIAALVYAIGALSAGRDDLGAWPPADPVAPLTGPAPTAAFVPPVDPSAPSR